jgi:hypothetical protein
MITKPTNRLDFGSRTGFDRRTLLNAIHGPGAFRNFKDGVVATSNRKPPVRNGPPRGRRFKIARLTSYHALIVVFGWASGCVEFNWSMLRRAAALNGPTDIALTFADYIASKNEKARRFEQLTSDTITFIEEIERVAAAPVSLISTSRQLANFLSLIGR